MFAFYNLKRRRYKNWKRRCNRASNFFKKYLVADNDEANGQRVGGFGSTK